MMIFQALLLIILLYFIYFLYLFIFSKKHDGKTIPTVKGQLPFIGHGLQFQKDPLAFIKGAYRRYGNIFKVKIFRSTVAIICDRDMVKQYAKSKEQELSMHDFLIKIYFLEAFFDNLENFMSAIKLIKNTVVIKSDEFTTKINDEANKMLHRLLEKNGKIVDLKTELMSYISRATARCFVGIELDSDFIYHLSEFVKIFNKIIVLTYLLPKWFLQLTIGKYYLDPHRKYMTGVLNNVIEKYRQDPNKNDSVIIRNAINTNGNLTNEQIGNIIVCLLYVSSENTTLGLSATLTELAYHGQHWDTLRDECKKILDSNDLKAIFTSPLINACVMESARTCAHVLSINRRRKKCEMLGDYYVGDVDFVALCGPMLTCHDCSHDKFKDTQKYDPDRFLPPRNEPYDPNSVMTWGPSGPHLCPGKQFALYEIKMGMALLVTHLKRFKIDPDEYHNVNYFSSAAFAERKIMVRVEKITEIFAKN